MRLSWVLLCVILLPALALTAVADTGDNGLMCNSFGGVCANPVQITAQNTGDITGNLSYYSANFPDFVRVIDTNPNNSWTSPWMLDNQNGIQQPSVTFGSALKGDVLVVQLCDQELQITLCARGARNPYLFASDPAYSVDGKSHALANTLGGGTTTLKDGTLVWQLWLEDLDDKWDTDWDYNDSVISLHNVEISFASSQENAPVPEPASISLLASGIAAACWRKFRA